MQAAIKTSAERTGRWAVVAIGASIPISTALDNILCVAVIACFVLTGQFWTTLRSLRNNAVYTAALLLFGMLALGTFYADVARSEALGQLLKYLDLLLIPVFALFFRSADVRRHALYALAAAIAVSVSLSYLLALGVVPKTALHAHLSLYPVPFKHTLSHTMLVAFGSFLFFQLSGTLTARWRWTFVALCIFAVMNIIFLVPGRTALGVLAALAAYCGYARWRWKGLAATAMLLVLVFLAAYSTSSIVRTYADRAVSESLNWSPSTPEVRAHSVGLRLEFYSNTLPIIREHPLFGVGTGGFAQAYAQQVAGKGMDATRNPHSEYLLMAAQVGLLGLACVLYLFIRQWQLAARLATSLEVHLARGLVIMFALGCLFNSMLLDHTEGLLFSWLTALLYSSLRTDSLSSSAAS